MAKRLVIHALFTYTDPSTKQRRTAMRGELINVGREDQARGEKFGAFGTEADLVPPGLDDGVVEVPAQEPTGTPVVPHVSRAAILEGALRQRLGVEPGATEAQVLAALDQALTKAPAGTTAEPATPTPGEPVIVNLPAPGDGGTLPDRQPGSDTVPAVLSDGGELVDEGQADGAESESDADAAAPAVRLERPPLAATKDRWEAFAVQEGEDPGQAKAMSKKDLQVKYGGE
jgi:hypothetical protein